MARWFRDSTGRFEQRPFLEQAEILDLALQLARSLPSENPAWPLTDDFLENLVEANTERYDPFADLSQVGADVDGYTLFSRQSKPKVLINQDLAGIKNRLRKRMTIAHELGHVILHQPLYERKNRQMDMLVEQQCAPALCEQKQIVHGTDWCEWQASFFGSTLLMPPEIVRARLCTDLPAVTMGVEDQTPSALQAASIVASHFEVSLASARVRLSQLGIIKPIGVVGFEELTALELTT